MIHRIIDIIVQTGRGATKPPKIFTNSFLMLDRDFVLCFCLLVFSNALQNYVFQSIDLKSQHIKSYIILPCSKLYAYLTELMLCVPQSVPLTGD